MEQNATQMVGKVLKGQKEGGEYVIHDSLSSGAYSTVFAATCQRTQTEYAAKFMADPIDSQMEANILLVINGLNLRYPEHICRLCDVASFDDQKNRGLIIEKGACSLYDIMSANDCEPMPGRHVKRIIYQLLCAGQSLQEWKLVHVDVKPENILLKNQTRLFHYDRDGKNHFELMDPVIMLCDFNCSHYAPEYSTHEGAIQTFHYRAPEVVLAIKETANLDVFSTGALMAELLSGEIVFNMEQRDQVKPTLKQRAAHLLLLESVMGECPADVLKQSSFKHFHGRSWRRDVINRPANKEFSHWRGSQFDQEMLAVLDGTMAWPLARLDAATAKNLSYFASRENDDPRAYINMTEISASEFLLASAGDESVVWTKLEVDE